MTFAEEFAEAMNGPGGIVEALGRGIVFRRVSGGTRDYTAGTRTKDEDDLPITAVRSEVMDTAVPVGPDKGRVIQSAYIVPKATLVFDASEYTPTRRDKIVDGAVWDIVGVHEHAEGTAWMIRVERG